jgi:hypothetical protein
VDWEKRASLLEKPWIITRNAEFREFNHLTKKRIQERLELKCYDLSDAEETTFGPLHRENFLLMTVLRVYKLCCAKIIQTTSRLIEQNHLRRESINLILRQCISLAKKNDIGFESCYVVLMAVQDMLFSFTHAGGQKTIIFYNESRSFAIEYDAHDHKYYVIGGEKFKTLHRSIVMPPTHKQNIPYLLSENYAGASTRRRYREEKFVVGSPDTIPGAFHFNESLYHQYKHSLGLTHEMLSSDSSEVLKGDVMYIVDTMYPHLES